MSETIERVAAAMETRRKELINQPLARIWSDLARAAIEAMREPTAGMVAAALPCERDEDYGHSAKKLGAAAVLMVGGGKDIGRLEGMAVEQAAFMVRDYRLMIGAALSDDRLEQARKDG